MKTHCRKWVWGYCDCLGISFIFRLTTFDVRIRHQKPSNAENRVFHFSLNKGYIGKAIFSRSFSARYHILKKKKKIYWVYVAVVMVITLSLLATCQGGGPRVVASTAAFHARVRGSVPGLGGLKKNKNVSSPSTCESQYCGEPPWPRGGVLGLRPPGLEFRILCLEDSVISIISPSSGGSPGPV